MTITNDNIVHQVFLAVEDEGYLPVGEKLSLEYLESVMDGIFPSKKSWQAFVRGNFFYDKEYFRDTLKDSTVKRWCRPANEYKDKFVVQVGSDKWVKVDASDIELTFDYDPLYSRNANSSFPTAIEIYVTANIVN